MNNPILKWTKYLNRHFTKEDARTAEWYLKRCPTRLVVKKTQIKTTVRNHYVPPRRAKILKIGNTKCWQGCGQTKTLVPCCGNGKWSSHVGEEFGNFFEMLNINLPFNPEILLLGPHPRKRKTHPPGDMCANIHSSITYISLKLQTIPMFVNRWTDEWGERYISPYNGVLLSNEKERIPNTCDNRHKLQKL